jgi:hypothetical protein
MWSTQGRFSTFSQFFFTFTTSLIRSGGQFWHQVVLDHPDCSCGGSNCGPSYQIQRQSPLNQLTIG